MTEDEEELEFPDSHAFVVLGSAAAVSDGLVAALGMAGYSVIHLKPASTTRKISDQEFEVDFSSEQSVSELESLIDGSVRPGAIINLLNLDQSRQASGSAPSRSLFLILKLFAENLESAITEGAGWLINFTLLDGKFGHGDTEASHIMAPDQAASIGLSKSVGREWPGLRVKCIDIEPDMEPHMMLAQVLEELETANNSIEVGVNSQGRYELELSTEQQDATEELKLDEESVILITGGAYGITAKFARYIAKNFQSRLVLLGRSSEPEAESADSIAYTASGELRKHLISKARDTGIKVTPAEIERELRSVLKNREIRENFAQIRASGSELVYHSIDISDADAFRRIIDDTYEQYGRIDGIIHGAGIIDDSLLKNKPLSSYERVLATKTVASRVMLEALKPQGLKFVLFFSSVAARFGNVGQSDYSAANEVLNKTALLMRKKWPDTHAVSINWGPWNAGMVSESLANLYASKGLHLIPPEVGLQLGIRELLENTESEVLIAADTNKISQWGLG